MIPRKEFGLRGSIDHGPDAVLATWQRTGVLDRLFFNPPITFPLVKPDTFGGRRPYTPLAFKKHMPSRPARGGEL